MTEAQEKEYEQLLADKKKSEEKAKADAEQLAKDEREEWKKAAEDFIKDKPFLEKIKNEWPIIQGQEQKQTPEGLMAHAMADMFAHSKGEATIKDGRIIRNVFKENGKVITRTADPQLVGTAASGGYFVPDLTQGSILEYVTTYGQAYQIGMTQFPMEQNVVNIPTELTNPTWDWNIAEAGSVTSSKATWGVTTLTPKKGGAIVVFTPELLMGAYLGVAAYVNKKVGIARATGTDDQVFAGTGSPFTGLFTTGITWGNTETMDGININTLKYRNFTKARYGVDEAKLVGASWLMNRLVMEQCRNINDEIGRPMFVEANGDTPPTILGKPVKLIEAAPSAGVASTPTVLLGNFSNSIIGNVQGAMRMRMLYEATIDSTSLAQNDLVGIRVMDQMAYSNGLVLEYSAIQCPA